MARYLRGLLGARDEPGPTERELLGVFLARRDAASLGEIVRRHGPLVWGVCRRVLGDAAEANDPFLVSFVALASRPGEVRPAEALGCWLHRVAALAAARSRGGAATIVYGRRDALAEGLWMRLAPLLDDQVARLPWKPRAAVILCDLEGRTRKEAARLLGWPEKRVSARLGEGRARLAAGLRRAGLQVTTGDLAVALAQNVAWGVPETCLGQTAAAALTPADAVARQADDVLSAASPRRLRWGWVAAALFAAATPGLAFLLAPRGEPPVTVEPARPMRHVGLARLAVSGTRVASAGGGEVRLWDAVTGEEIRRLAGLKGAGALSFLPGGDAVLVADEVAVRLWTAGGARVLTHVAAGEAEVVAASPDGGRAAWGGRSGLVQVWEINTGKRLRSFQGPAYQVLDLAFGPGGRALAVAGGDNTSALFDVGTGKPLSPPHDHKLVQSCVAVSPDGVLIASGGHGGVTLRDAATGRVAHWLELAGAVRAIRFAHDGRSLLACDDAGAVHTWDLATGHELRHAPLASPGRPVALSPDGRHFAWAAGDELRGAALEP
jgi:DNA-directed RNA polymerase specialized sigma24 family protein